MSFLKVFFLVISISSSLAFATVYPVDVQSGDQIEYLRKIDGKNYSVVTYLVKDVQAVNAETVNVTVDSTEIKLADQTLIQKTTLKIEAPTQLAVDGYKEECPSFSSYA